MLSLFKAMYVNLGIQEDGWINKLVSNRLKIHRSGRNIHTKTTRAEKWPPSLPSPTLQPWVWTTYASHNLILILSKNDPYIIVGYKMVLFWLNMSDFFNSLAKLHIDQIAPTLPEDRSNSDKRLAQGSTYVWQLFFLLFFCPFLSKGVCNSHHVHGVLGKEVVSPLWIFQELIFGFEFLWSKMLYLVVPRKRRRVRKFFAPKG